MVLPWRACSSAQRPAWRPGGACTIALDFARVTPARLAAAIDRILERNADLPAGERVRLVSISTGYRGDGGEVVDAALARALAADVFVLFSVYPVDHVDPPLAIRGLGCAPWPWRDCNSPRNFGVTPGEVRFWGDRGESVAQVLERRARHDADHALVTVYAPANRRTVAGRRHATDLVFDVEGGDSQWAPYLIGVLALALQQAPDLHATELAALLAEGVSEVRRGVRVIDPARVVALARAR
jgi:hypothetical protein